MGTANCPQVAPDRFTRPGILPGVLVVTLPVVEGDVAFLQGHALGRVRISTLRNENETFSQLNSITYIGVFLRLVTYSHLP